MIAGFHLPAMMPMIVSTRSTGSGSDICPTYTRLRKCACLTSYTRFRSVVLAPCRPAQDSSEETHAQAARHQPVGHHYSPSRRGDRGTRLAAVDREDDRWWFHGHAVPVRLGGGEGEAARPPHRRRPVSPPVRERRHGMAGCPHHPSLRRGRRAQVRVHHARRISAGGEGGGRRTGHFPHEVAREPPGGDRLAYGEIGHVRRKE